MRPEGAKAHMAIGFYMRPEGHKHITEGCCPYALLYRYDSSFSSLPFQPTPAVLLHCYMLQ